MSLNEPFKSRTVQNFEPLPYGKNSRIRIACLCRTTFPRFPAVQGAAMYYTHQILHRRKGKFGLLWLAATSPKSLRHVRLLTVPLAKLSEELQRELAHGLTGRQSLRFSLRLSCKLLCGLWVLYLKKAGAVRADQPAAGVSPLATQAEGEGEGDFLEELDRLLELKANREAPLVSPPPVQEEAPAAVVGEPISPIAKADGLPPARARSSTPPLALRPPPSPSLDVVEAAPVAAEASVAAAEAGVAAAEASVAAAAPEVPADVPMEEEAPVAEPAAAPEVPADVPMEEEAPVAEPTAEEQAAAAMPPPRQPSPPSPAAPPQPAPSRKGVLKNLAKNSKRKVNSMSRIFKHNVPMERDEKSHTPSSQPLPPWLP
ncbi:hypothetical protein V5799_033768 [Amblyomma americanum]|uniref:Rad21/Rec8-like protein N-terminal domain-containing protein n=1 Tax=Amblyomma americanum TaxID=6943 RepID=A0AAQ4DMC9_AMBAM